MHVYTCVWVWLCKHDCSKQTWVHMNSPYTLKQIYNLTYIIITERELLLQILYNIFGLGITIMLANTSKGMNSLTLSYILQFNYEWMNDEYFLPPWQSKDWHYVIPLGESFGVSLIVLCKHFIIVLYKFNLNGLENQNGTKNTLALD